MIQRLVAEVPARRLRRALLLRATDWQAGGPCVRAGAFGRRMVVNSCRRLLRRAVKVS